MVFAEVMADLKRRSKNQEASVEEWNAQMQKAAEREMRKHATGLQWAEPRYTVAVKGSPELLATTDPDHRSRVLPGAVRNAHAPGCRPAPR